MLHDLSDSWRTHGVGPAQKELEQCVGHGFAQDRAATTGLRSEISETRRTWLRPTFRNEKVRSSRTICRADCAMSKVRTRVANSDWCVAECGVVTSTRFCFLSIRPVRPGLFFKNPFGAARHYFKGSSAGRCSYRYRTVLPLPSVSIDGDFSDILQEFRGAVPLSVVIFSLYGAAESQCGNLPAGTRCCAAQRRKLSSSLPLGCGTLPMPGPSILNRVRKWWFHKERISMASPLRMRAPVSRTPCPADER